jgi:N-acetylglutamate synthase-like GNAT family acetyltransferase
MSHEESQMRTTSAQQSGRAAAVRVEELSPTPERLLGVREELNQLEYGPSTVLLATADGQIVGAVRYALRHDPWRKHGLIADLQVDEDYRDIGLEERLITAAEERLEGHGVRKIDALILDGQGWAPYFYRLGYWASRKTVAMEWDLRDLGPVQDSHDCVVERVDRPDVEEMSQLVLSSYQPYWRWWREYREDKRWYRVEFPAENVPLETAELEAEMRDRVRARVRRIADESDRTIFLARHDGRLVGVCDAVRRPEGDQLEFGVLVLRDFGGKRLGSALLGRALHWLRDGGLERARVTTTSGLDDYDPTVYLYNLSYGARILAEFVDLVKHTSAGQPSAKTLP